MKDLSLHLMDIVQNSISAGATKITVAVGADTARNTLTVRVADNGKGMEQEMLEKVTNPFVTSRTTRKVGLGIPLFKTSAEMAGGHLFVESEKGKGTALEACFAIDHIDRLPLGDIAETMTGLILTSPDIEYELILNEGAKEFRLNSFEVKDKLGEVPITAFEVIEWIRDYINEGVKTTFGGVLNEIIS